MITQISYPVEQGEILFKLTTSIRSAYPQLRSSSTYRFETSKFRSHIWTLDLVEHKDEWLESFNIGRNNLLLDDQNIYDEIERELTPNRSYQPS